MPTFLFRAVFLVSAFFPTWVFGQNRSENPWQWSCRNRLVLAGTDLVPEDQAKIETVETVPVKGGRVARNEPDQTQIQLGPIELQLIKMKTDISSFSQNAVERDLEDQTKLVVALETALNTIQKNPWLVRDSSFLGQELLDLLSQASQLRMKDFQAVKFGRGANARALRARDSARALREATVYIVGNIAELFERAKEYGGSLTEILGVLAPAQWGVLRGAVSNALAFHERSSPTAATAATAADLLDQHGGHADRRW